jgi:hypothetical protein
MNFKKILIIGLALLTPFPAVASKSSKWHKETVQGFNKYWTENETGSRFIIWCHPTRKKMGTVVDIDIEGASAPANKRIRIVLDRDMIKLPADGKGYIQTKCTTCADSYKFLWNRLRSSTYLAVKFADERYAAFSLVGARTTLPGAVCPSDFEKRQPGG